MRMQRTLATAVLVAGATFTTATAQTGVVGGTVMRDSLGHGLGDAQVTIPELNLGTRTNYNGEFRLDGVSVGRHALMIRHVGFAPFVDSVTVRAGQPVDQEWVLTEAPVKLDSQVTVAKGRPSNPNLVEFEERRKLGFGRFVDEDELRKIQGGRPLINYLSARIPGLTMYQPEPNARPGDYYLSSGRGPTPGKYRCPITIYMDGAIYSGSDAPDISKLSPDDFSAVEYYAGGATIPPKYNITRDGCGVLLLWRRYR